MHATGTLQSTGLEFWNTRRPGQSAFTYKAGVGNVIKGWDKGCLGMRVGEHRRLIIPAEDGYGAAGFRSWGIPPGATLCFHLECVAVK